MSKFKQKTFVQLIIFCVLLLTGQLWAQNFSVVGNKIYDPEGNEFIAQGTNVTGEGSLWNNTTLADKDKIINCWNFNTIRLYFKLYTNSSVTDQDAYDVIDAFTAEKIVVIVEVHDNIGKYFENEELYDLINFWRDMASKYKNNPYVWFDLHNEPGNGTVDFRWVTQHQEVIKVIRDEVFADNIIIVEGGAWGQDAPTAGFGDVPPETSTILTYGDQVKNFNGFEYENIIFSLHIYDQYRLGGPDRIVNYIDAIWAKGHALIIGEWGNHNVSDVSAAMHAFAEAMHLRKVGRVVWHWEGGDNNDLTQIGRGSSINDCTNPTNLTDLGKYVWLDNHLDPFDTIPPPIINTIQQINTTSVSFDIMWDEPEVLDIKGYYIYMNNAIVDTVFFPFHSFEGLSPETTYDVGVKAFDLKLNASPLKNLKLNTLEPDVILPSKPQNLNASLIKSRELSLEYTTSTDNQGIKSYQIYLNNQLFTSSFDTAITLKNLNPDTDYSIHVQSVDLSGNLSEESEALIVKTYPVENYAIINNNVKGDGLLQFNFIGNEWQTRRGISTLYMNDEEHTYKISNMMEFRFAGTKVLLYGKTAPSLGMAEIQIDGITIDTINYHETVETPKTLLFESPELLDEEHILVLKPIIENKYINMDWVEVICTGCYISSVPATPIIDIKIYPLPAKEYIYISGNEPIISAKLLSLDGKTVKSFTAGHQHLNILNIKDVNAGFYILSIHLKNEGFKSFTIPIKN